MSLLGVWWLLKTTISCIIHCLIMLVFLSALVDVAEHAGNLDAAFEVIQEACNEGIHVGIMAYSSVMADLCYL